MKVRNGFVTNSSSSSYIIAYKNLFDIDEETREKYKWMVSLTDALVKLIKNDSNRRAFNCDTKEQFDNDFMDFMRESYDSIEDWFKNCAEWDDDYTPSIYNKAIEYLNNGYSIMLQEVDYDDEILCKLFKSLDDGNSFIIISSDGE